ncbi:MAG: DUF1499 domain-containing protein, partial [Rubritepida sp.]|nr:DUF1499 domain-containing protein [Rubritepida sp.]
GAGLFLYSRSLFGWSDLGANRARVDRWLAALASAAWPPPHSAVVAQVACTFVRTHALGAWRLQSQWVERSALLNYPDIIVAEAVPGPQGGAGLFLYSRSLFGWSDLGVNRARVDRWLAALASAA